MKRLLEKLKILDPACYAEIARGLEQVDIEYEDDIIQGACQRAIVARGWAFHVAYCPPEGPTKWYYQAFMWPEMICKSTKADTPAKAILTAYVEARKAHPCHL